MKEIFNSIHFQENNGLSTALTSTCFRTVLDHEKDQSHWTCEHTLSFTHSRERVLVQTEGHKCLIQAPSENYQHTPNFNEILLTS